LQKRLLPKWYIVAQGRSVHGRGFYEAPSDSSVHRKVGAGVNFFKKIFGKNTKQEIEPMHGSPVAQTQGEQDATRERMETEMAGQKAQREEANAPAPEEPSEKSQ
jgi:hypothetical protein